MMKTIHFLLILTTLITFSCAHKTKKAGEQDHFQNFAQIKETKVLGIDYSVTLRDQKSKILVTAFHGGFTESGTTELGEAITQNPEDEIDFYAFNSLKPGNMHEPSFTSSTLHITSTRFDDPALLDMLPAKDFCLGLHGFGGQEADFCVGGGNEKERARLVGLLKDKFPSLKTCELCCPPYNGTSLKNPINRCQQKGVQVEMSPKVRKLILKDSDFLDQLSNHFKIYLKSSIAIEKRP